MSLSNPNRRRIKVAGIAAVLAAVAGALAFAHSGGARHGGRAASPQHHLEHMQALLTQVGATDAQKEQINGLLEPALAEMHAAHDAHFAAFKQFHAELFAPSLDRARIETLRAEQVRAIDATTKRLVTTISDAAEVLSPEQRAAFAREIAKRHGG